MRSSLDSSYHCEFIYNASFEYYIFTTGPNLQARQFTRLMVELRKQLVDSLTTTYVQTRAHQHIITHEPSRFVVSILSGLGIFWGEDFPDCVVSDVVGFCYELRRGRTAAQPPVLIHGIRILRCETHIHPFICKTRVIRMS
jgi:hypothetical protein